jgi:hypothetical protein
MSESSESGGTPSALLTIERLAPSEDFVNLIAENVSPEHYGRAPELDQQDQTIWSEIMRIEQRAWFSSATSAAILGFLTLLTATVATLFGLGIPQLLLR